LRLTVDNSHVQVAVHGGWKATAVAQLVLYVSHLLLLIKEQKPNVWGHVPEMLLECAVCSFHALQRTQATPLTPATITMATLLTELLTDSKLASPYMHDVVLQSMANLLNSRMCLEVVQDDADLMSRLVPRLMMLYDQEHWMTLTHVFLQAVGRDAASRLGDTPPEPSGLCRSIKRLCLQRTNAAIAFLHQLFSALDWSATEVTVALREIADGSRADSPPLRRRVVVLFSLAVTCCELLSFLFSECPSVFLAGPPVFASRLSEMLAFLVVHAPVDPSSPNFRALQDVASVIEPSRVLHPLALASPVACMFGACWAYERGSPDVYGRKLREQCDLAGADAVPEAITNSVVRLLIDMEAACPTAALEALARAPWGQTKVGEGELTALKENTELVMELIDEVKVRRAMSRTNESVCPSEFLDPIMMTPMLDPVRLPDSGIIVDRVTIERHLMVSATDPYSRSELSMSDLEDVVDLRDRIEAWRSGKDPSREESLVHAAKTISSHAPTDWEDLDSDSSS
jgi:hypothetical protein